MNKLQRKVRHLGVGEREGGHSPLEIGVADDDHGVQGDTVPHSDACLKCQHHINRNWAGCSSGLFFGKTFQKKVFTRNESVRSKSL